MCRHAMAEIWRSTKQQVRADVTMLALLAVLAALACLTMHQVKADTAMQTSAFCKKESLHSSAQTQNLHVPRNDA